MNFARQACWAHAKIERTCFGDHFNVSRQNAMVQPPEASIRASQELTLCIDFHKVWSPTDMIHSSPGTQTASLLRQRLCTLFLRAAVGGYTGACASKATADLGRSSSISKKGTTTNKTKLCKVAVPPSLRKISPKPGLLVTTRAPVA